MTLKDLQRELKVLQARVNGHDAKFEQTTEKLEQDYVELKDLRSKVDQTAESTSKNSTELQDLKGRVDEGERKLEATSVKLDAIQETVEMDRAQTIVHIADHCERLDQASNAAKVHCVLVTGKITKSSINRSPFHLSFKLSFIARNEK